MIIQLFKNRKGLIYGDDEHRIDCKLAGVLKIGITAINVSPGADTILPSLANGEYKAIFTTTDGDVYELERVSVRRGRVVQPSKETLEIMELRSRLDEVESACDALNEKVRELSNIFDTNSLNFLINN